jgi:hypothetical protein
MASAGVVLENACLKSLNLRSSDVCGVVQMGLGCRWAGLKTCAHAHLKRAVDAAFCVCVLVIPAPVFVALAIWLQPRPLALFQFQRNHVRRIGGTSKYCLRGNAGSSDSHLSKSQSEQNWCQGLGGAGAGTECDIAVSFPLRGCVFLSLLFFLSARTSLLLMDLLADLHTRRLYYRTRLLAS